MFAWTGLLLIPSIMRTVTRVQAHFLFVNARECKHASSAAWVSCMHMYSNIHNTNEYIHGFQTLFLRTSECAQLILRLNVFTCMFTCVVWRTLSHTDPCCTSPGQDMAVRLRTRPRCFRRLGRPGRRYSQINEVQTNGRHHMLRKSLKDFFCKRRRCSCLGYRERGTFPAPGYRVPACKHRAPACRLVSTGLPLAGL